jgi:hypothetical protein
VFVVTEQNLPEAFGVGAGARSENQSQCQKRVLQEFRQSSHSLSMICTAGISIAKCSGFTTETLSRRLTGLATKKRMLHIQNPIWNRNWIRSPASFFFAVELPDCLHLGGSGRALNSDLLDEATNISRRGATTGILTLSLRLIVWDFENFENG